MVIIKIINNKLIIEDKSNQIFEWNHRTFFNISLGFEFDDLNNIYSSKERNSFLSLVNDIIQYLIDEKLEFNTDDEVSLLIENIKDQSAEFELAKNYNYNYPIPPIALKRTLKNYQIKGVEHLLKVQHGANFSVPGSGKTTVVYAYFDILKRNNIVDKLFVVGPYSCFSPWEEESIQCFGEKIKTARLSSSHRQSSYLQSSKYELFLCNYQTMANDINDIISLCKEYRVLFVIDESHNIKRFDGGVWSNSALKISPYAERRVILSGTPMPNGFFDLWSQMTFLWPGKQLLGDKIVYKNRLQDISQNEIIKKEIRPFFYRVKKSDLNLPKPKFYKIIYSLNPIQFQIYHALSIKLLSDLKLQPIDNQKLRFWRKAKMIRLMQAATNPALLGQYSEEFEIPPLQAESLSVVKLIEQYSKYEIPAKFEAAVALTRRLLSEGKKVILWTSFIQNIKMLELLLIDLKQYSIFGAIPKDDNEDENFNREKIIREFKSINIPSVLIANPAACAESISLHKICHDAIYLDRTFNCGQYIQSLDRIHRIGLDSDETVNYHILIAKETIDETIERRLEEKHNIMLSVLEDDLPVGSFDVENYEMEQSENEEIIDFQETEKDVKKFCQLSK